MKYCFFLVSLVSSLYLIKAAPVRLQKRAAFYIANETACVVDNIVYSNGEPIPTDDPCEACKCRPPGFACVLKECRPKPGCRAVRRLGECCPDYVCGCEHDGKMYRDGEQIIDEKNPCYECHCQGSSIACAFVDCFYRIDCIPVYIPGECCPHYKNCSRDAPEKTSIIGDNALPPVNPLPQLYAPKVPDSTQSPTSPSTISEASDEAINGPHNTQSSESGNQEIELPENEDVDPESNDNTGEEQGLNEEQEVKEKVPGENVKISLINSKTDIEDREVTVDETTTEFPVEFSTEPKKEAVEEETQTGATDAEKVESEIEETTEKQDEVKTTVDELVTEKPVKNSAAENSKSLKIARDDDHVVESADVQEAEAVKHEVIGSNNKEENESVPDEESDKLQDNEETQTPANTPKLPTAEGNDATTIAVNDSPPIKTEATDTVTVVHVREKTETGSEITSTESSPKTSEEQDTGTVAPVQKQKEERSASPESSKPKENAGSINLEINVDDPEPSKSEPTKNQTPPSESEETSAPLTSESTEEPTTTGAPLNPESADETSAPQNSESREEPTTTATPPELKPESATVTTGAPLNPESAEETSAPQNPESREESTITVTPPELKPESATVTTGAPLNPESAEETSAPQNPESREELTLTVTPPELNPESATVTTGAPLNPGSADKTNSPADSVDVRSANLETLKSDDEQLVKRKDPEDIKAELEETDGGEIVNEAEENKSIQSEDLKQEEPEGVKADEPTALEETKESESSNQDVGKLN